MQIHSRVPNVSKKYLPTTTNKESTPALVSTILPQSSSDLDTEQGEIIDETLNKLHIQLIKCYLRDLQVVLPVT